jgi:hypothetical protein
VGHSGDLLPLHRLDSGTEGVTLLAKTPSFARYFHQLMSRASNPSSEGASKRLVKEYRAITTVAAPVGTLQHWAIVNSRSRHQPAFTRIVATQEATSVLCILEVLKVCAFITFRSGSSAWPCVVAPSAAVATGALSTGTCRVSRVYAVAPLVFNTRHTFPRYV